MIRLNPKKIIAILLSLSLFVGTPFLTSCWNKKNVDPDQPGHVHTIGEMVVENNVDPTCTEKGHYDEVRYCKVCKKEVSRETIEVPALGHSDGRTEIENNVDPTCTEKGHYDEVHYCIRCGKELSRETFEVDTLNHHAGEMAVENNIDPTCTEKGHYDEVHYCSLCGIEMSRNTITVDELGHSWDQGTVIKQASLYEEGEILYTCCRDESHTKIEIIPMIETAFVITIFDLATGDTLEEVRVASDGKYSLEDIYRPGYIFDGFFDKDGKQFPAEGTVSKDIQIYGKFKLQDTDTIEKLAEAAEGGASEIVVSKDIVIDRPVYFTGTTKLTATKDITFTRDPNYSGDMFVIGINSKNENPLFDFSKPVLSIGDSNGDSGKITFDGNRENMKVDVVGTALFITQSGVVNFFDGASIINCHKVGNERVYDSINIIGTPVRVGGSAVILARGVFNMQGGLIDNCSVNTSNIGGESDSEDYLLSSRGGAIFSSGQFIMDGGVISNCEAHYGGVMYITYSVQIRKGTFTGNSAYSAGVLYSSGSSSCDIRIGYHEGQTDETLVVFENNKATAKAGALYSSVLSPMVIYNTKFVGNMTTASSANGGAIVSSGPVILRKCIFDSNTSGYAGGAIYQFYLSTKYTPTYLEAYDTTFFNNRGQKGGAIMLGASSSILDKGTNAIIERCTFDSNTAYAVIKETVDNTDPDNPVINTTSSNGNGGAVYVTKNSVVKINDCHFTSNNAEGISGCINSTDGGDVTITNTLFEDNKSVGTGGVMSIYGGSKLNMDNCTFLRNESGENGGAVYLSGMTVTLSNLLFEYNKGKSGGAIYANGNSNLTLLKATFNYNETKSGGLGGAIYFKDSTLTIDEKSEGDVVFNGNKGINGGAIAAGSSAILNVRGGRFINNESTKTGGAIYLASSLKATIENTIFDGNTVTGRGGAIYMNKNTLLDVMSCTFNNNAANYGGSYYTGAGCDTKITSSTFDNNSTTDTETGYGAGLCVEGLSYVEIENCDFTNNSAIKSGGGISASGCALILKGNNNFNSNYAATYGGGLHISSGNTLSLPEGTIFDGNRANSNTGGAVYMTKTTNATIDGVVFTSNYAGTYGGALYVHNMTLDISNCTIGGEEEKGNTGKTGGGAMYISTNGIVNFNNCDISYNTSKSGAGLYLNNGKEINIFNCNIHHNNASIYGGAIYMNNVNGSKLTIVAGETEQENTIIANNSSVDVGGAIYVLLNTTIDLDSVTFENNSGKSGGAIYAEGAIIEAKNTLFINNNAVKHGGAIYAFPYTDEETNVKTHSSVSLLDNTTFESNNAGTESSTGSYGGAVYMNSGTLTADNASFLNNKSHSSSYGGGAMYLSGVTASVIDSTIGGNIADAYGGFAAIFSSTNLTLTDSTFTNNQAALGGVVYNSKSTVISEGSTYSNNSALFRTTTEVDDTDPNNPIETTTVSDGKGGVFYSGNQSSLSIVDSENGSNSFTNNTACTGGVIFGYYYIQLDISNASFVKNSVTVQEGLSESGFGGAIYLYKNSNSSVVNINNCHLERNTAVSGGVIYAKAVPVSLTGGNLFYLNNATSGGAIYSKAATFTVGEGSDFSANTATNGGAIYVDGGTFEITSTEFSSNSADNGGGAIYINETSTVTISGTSSFNNGSATNGGAIYLTSGTLNVDGPVLFKGNSSSSNGGALYLTGSGDITFTGTSVNNIVFDDNASNGHGGAMYIYKASGTNTFTYVTFKNNYANSDGGVAYIHTSTATFNSCSFGVDGEGNRAKERGGVFLMAASSNVVINGNTSVYDNGAKIGGFIAFNPSAGSPSVIINGTLTAEGNTATNNGQFIHGVKIATGKQDIVEVDKANIVYNDLDSWELEDIITGTTTINSHPEP